MNNAIIKNCIKTDKTFVIFNNCIFNFQIIKIECKTYHRIKRKVYNNIFVHFPILPISARWMSARLTFYFNRSTIIGFVNVSLYIFLIILYSIFLVIAFIPIVYLANVLYLTLEFKLSYFFI